MTPEKGQTGPVIIPYDDLIREKRGDLQTKVIIQLIREANKLGLEGKEVTELVSHPTFAVHDLKLSLKWKKK